MVRQQVPQRKMVRNPLLDASLVHVEQALLHRATEIERENSPTVQPGPALLAIAREFRILAEELHYW